MARGPYVAMGHDAQKFEVQKRKKDLVPVYFKFGDGVSESLYVGNAEVAEIANEETNAVLEPLSKKAKIENIGSENVNTTPLAAEVKIDETYEEKERITPNGINYQSAVDKDLEIEMKIIAKREEAIQKRKKLAELRKEHELNLKEKENIF